MTTTVPDSLPSLSSDGAKLAAIGHLLCTLSAPTASIDTSMMRSQSAIELEPVETPSKMRVTNVLPLVGADTVSTTAVAPSPTEFTFATLSGNTSDTEKLPKGPESDDSDDEYWLKEYAKRHRKRPGSSAALRLEKRLLVLKEVSARRRNSAGAREESTEEILQSLYQALSAEKSRGEALSSPTLRSQERSGPFEVAIEKHLPGETHSATHPPTEIDAAFPELTKELDRKVEKQVQPGKKRNLAGPASAKARRNKKKARTEKPRARKPSAPRREKKTVGMEAKSKAMVTTVEKPKPYTTQSGRLVKKTHKMEEVARCLLVSF